MFSSKFLIYSGVKIILLKFDKLTRSTWDAKQQSVTINRQKSYRWYFFRNKKLTTSEKIQKLKN